MFFKDPFEFQFGYLIYILLLPVLINRYGFNKNILAVFLMLLVVGIIQISTGNNTAPLFFKVFGGLVLSYFFYDLVIHEFDFDIRNLFKWYLKGCVIASLLGLMQFVFYQVGYETGAKFWGIFNKWSFASGGLFGLRINSIFAEPTHLATVMSAAFFISVYNLIKKENFLISKKESIIIVVTYVLSFSGVGQLGIFLTLAMLAVSFGFIRYVFIIAPLMLVLFNYLYNNVNDFRERYDSLVGLSQGEEFKLGKTHGSSFILYNNYVVTKENFKTNFLFGSGIGSHPVAFEKYSLAKDVKVSGINVNSADANSMFLRLVSETGLFGTGLFLLILIKGYVKRDPENDTYHWLVSNAILIMILLNLFRQGHYFLNGFPFFVLLYYYNSISYNNYLADKSEEKKTAESLETVTP